MKRTATTLLSLFISAWSGAGQVASQPKVQSGRLRSRAVARNVRTRDLRSISRARYKFSLFFLRSICPAPAGGKVTFEPGARSAWHMHPFGQILIVTEGMGWVQQWGGSIEEIREGDVIRIPPRVKQSRRLFGESQRRAISNRKDGIDASSK